MEIYKLKDKVPEGRNGRAKGADGEDLSDELKITDLKQGVKNPNRVNVFVNGEFSFSLDVAQVVDLGVKVGLVLDEARLAELKRASEFGKAYQRALEWALVRPRSVRELRDYLRRSAAKREMKEKKGEWERTRELTEVVAKGEDAERLEQKNAKIAEKMNGRERYDFDDLIVGRLCERGYVDDRKFAEFWVENRFVKKGVSRKRLAIELMKKGIAQEVIDEVLDGRDDREEILKMIAKKRGKYDDPDKLVAYLCRQGFSYDLVREVVESAY